MIILDTTTKSVELILAAAPAANQLAYMTNYIDIEAPNTHNPASNDGLTTGVTAVTAIAAPAGTKRRQVKSIMVFNLDTGKVTLTCRMNNNTTMRTLWSGTLLPSESLVYTDGRGFDVIGANGIRLIEDLGAQGGGVESQSVIELSNQQRVFRSNLVDYSNLTLVDNTTYALYVGRTVSAITVAYVEYYCTSAHTGSPGTWVGILSSPSSPNRQGQTFTWLTSGLSTDGANTVCRNDVSFAYSVPAGTHLWAWIGTTTAPTINTGVRTVGYDLGLGIMQTWSELTTQTTGFQIRGIVATLVDTTNYPQLWVTLD